MVTNGGQPFGAEKPDGPVPGRRTGYPSKTPHWGVFESTKKSKISLPQRAGVFPKSML